MDRVKINTVFKMFDKNGDGKISRKEMSESLQNLGIYIPEEDLSQMIEKVDLNGDDCVLMNSVSYINPLWVIRMKRKI